MKTTKKIVIDARLLGSTTGRYMLKLVLNLEKIDHSNKYFIIIDPKDASLWRPSSSNFTAIECRANPYTVREQLILLNIIDKISPDLVHFCMPQQPVLYKGKKVTTIHDLTLLKTYNSDKNLLIYRFKQFIGFFVFKSVIKNSNQIIVPSNFTKSEVIKLDKSAKNKINLTYESADVSLGSLKKYSHPFKNFILYVGQQSDYKNIKRLGDAHQLLLKKYPDLGLILVGKKNASSKINENYFNNKKYKNIIFTDFLPDSQKDWLYTQAVAYVFPSLMEGFGLPGLEAMGHGAPVISSSTTCLPEIYGDAAIYFDPYDIKDMASKISDVLENETLRKKMITKGHAQFKKYSWERMARETLEIYNKVLEN